MDLITGLVWSSWSGVLPDKGAAERRPIGSRDHQDMNRMVWWDGLDQWRAEVSEIDLGSGRLSASGVPIGVDPLPYRLDYAVVTSAVFAPLR